MFNMNWDRAADCWRAVFRMVGFPAPVSPLIGDTDIDQFDVFAQKLMDDVLLPFAKNNIYSSVFLRPSKYPK
jgi:hypothetical protein